MLRALHPGPLATFQGKAQLTGLLKQQSQDVVLMADNIALSVWDEPYSSESTDSDSGAAAAYERRTHADFTSAAAASTSRDGNSVALRAIKGLGLPGGGTAAAASATAAASASGVPNIIMAGVFDGHGGEMSARYAHDAILHRVASDYALHVSLGMGDVEGTAVALKNAYSEVDADLLSLAASRPAPEFRDGTTALLTLQLGGLLVVANAGDCRAVLSRGGQAVRLSQDHTPALRSERERIEAAGGKVVVARGAARVLVPLDGSADVMRALSVSRSLGDPDFKAPGFVTAEPDVCVVPLQEGTDAFLIAASDGLWGRVSDQNAVDCVAGVLQNYAGMPRHRASAPKAAARALLALAADSGSTDDVSVVVSVFHWGA